MAWGFLGMGLGFLLVLCGFLFVFLENLIICNGLEDLFPVS